MDSYSRTIIKTNLQRIRESMQFNKSTSTWLKVSFNPNVFERFFRDINY